MAHKISLSCLFVPLTSLRLRIISFSETVSTSKSKQTAVKQHNNGHMFLTIHVQVVRV